MENNVESECKACEDFEEEVRILKDQLKKVTSELQLTKSEKNALMNRLKHAEYTIENVKHDMSELWKKHRLKIATIEDLKTQLEEAQGKSTDGAPEKDNDERKIQDLEKQLEEMASKMKLVTSERDTLSRKVHQLEDSLSKKSEDVTSTDSEPVVSVSRLVSAGRQLLSRLKSNGWFSKVDLVQETSNGSSASSHDYNRDVISVTSSGNIPRLTSTAFIQNLFLEALSTNECPTCGQIFERTTTEEEIKCHIQEHY